MTDHDLAEAVRAACLRALLDAYEDAGMQGLCAEGRWEYAVQALKWLDLGPLLAQAQGGAGKPPPPER
jgi:hypothetical protein